MIRKLAKRADTDRVTTAPRALIELGLFVLEICPMILRLANNVVITEIIIIVTNPHTSRALLVMGLHRLIPKFATYVRGALSTIVRADTTEMAQNVMGNHSTTANHVESATTAQSIIVVPAIIKLELIVLEHHMTTRKYAMSVLTEAVFTCAILAHLRLENLALVSRTILKLVKSAVSAIASCVPLMTARNVLTHLF